MTDSIEEQSKAEFKRRAEGFVPLTVEALQELRDTLSSKTHFYVIATNSIPDDAFGVIFLRPDDAAKAIAKGKNAK